MKNDTQENTELMLKSKEKIYRLYYELIEFIKGEKVQINEEELKENLQTTKMQTLIQYIKESIDIIKKRALPKTKTPKSFYIGNTNIYENRLKKLENDIRYYLKKQFQYKIQREALELKLESYYKIEEDFEEMKEKLKYEEGQFLDNDRKDNEILILRAENSNLKKEITRLEEDKKHYQTEKENDKVTISDLKTQIEKLAEKVNQLEKNQKDINSNSNSSSINININNNGSTSSKWVIKHENIQRPGNIMSSSTDSKTMNDMSSSNIKSASKTSYLNHHKTNSMNMNMKIRDKNTEIITRQLSGNYQSNSGNKYKKCNAPNLEKSNVNNNNLSPDQKNPKTPRVVQNQQQVATSLTKGLNSQKGNKGANKPILSVRASSRLSQHY